MARLLRSASERRLVLALDVLDERARKRGLVPRERFARVLVTRELRKRRA